MRQTYRLFATMASLGLACVVGCGPAGSGASGPATPTEVEVEVAQAAGPADAPAAERTLADWAELVTSDDAASRREAITRLRSAQRAGLAALAEAQKEARAELLAGKRSPKLDLVRDAFDAVAAQRDAHVSLLYWHTDLDAAKREAQATSRPILSLRLLGRLDEEMSCANSRFFRVALYSNEAIANRLEASFVLHWQSERPVPRVTIDMGDGRKLERTITGNSIHYVLDPEGRPIEALPGLYGPRRFDEALQRATELATILGESEQWEIALRGYHGRQRDRLALAWQNELQLVGAAPVLPPAPRPRTSAAPSAATSVPIAMPKAMVEAPMVRAIGLGDTVPLPTPLEGDAWNALVERELEASRLDARSRSLLVAKLGAKEGESTDGLIASFERAVAEDMVQNEYALHRTLHEWMSQTPPTTDLERLNARVYTDLFLTPRSDPWLGLKPTDVYTGIEGDGVVGALGSR